MESTILKAADITAAKRAITDYETACNAIYVKMAQTLSDLTAIGRGFNGDSADGFNDFFNQLAPCVTTTPPQGGTSSLFALTEGLRGILDEIAQELLNKEDPDLGNANRSAVTTAAGV